MFLPRLNCALLTPGAAFPESSESPLGSASRRVLARFCSAGALSVHGHYCSNYTVSCCTAELVEKKLREQPDSCSRLALTVPRHTYGERHPLRYNNGAGVVAIPPLLFGQRLCLWLTSAHCLNLGQRPIDVTASSTSPGAFASWRVPLHSARKPVSLGTDQEVLDRTHCSLRVRLRCQSCRSASASAAENSSRSP